MKKYTGILRIFCTVKVFITHKCEELLFYRPQRSCDGYLFTPVCLSMGGSASVHAGIPHGSDTPWDQTPPGAGTTPGPSTPQSRHYPLGSDTTPPQQQTATVADGTHPTGMHSCFGDLFTVSPKRKGNSETTLDI